MGRLRFNPEAQGILDQNDQYVIHQQPIQFTNPNRPLMVEIGMGKGGFLLENALRHPETNYLGLEKFATIMIKALKK